MGVVLWLSGIMVADHVATCRVLDTARHPVPRGPTAHDSGCYNKVDRIFLQDPVPAVQLEVFDVVIRLLQSRHPLLATSKCQAPQEAGSAALFDNPLAG